jgi:UDP-3-O-[3-hydroxymyristoyl] glucosamine N-acyltransferase
MADPRFYLTAAPVAVAEAASLAQALVQRGGQSPVGRAAALDDEDLEKAVVFAETAKAIAMLDGRLVGLCLTTEALAPNCKFDGGLAVASNPKLAFARFAAAMHRSRSFAPEPGVHPSVSIATGARIHGTSVIAENAEIGPGASIGPNAVIGPGVLIGADCAVGPNCVVTHAILGARTVLLAGAVIGEAGFGFAVAPEGPVRLPQLGRVLIGDDVEIGANACVDRGTLGDTVIESGVKLDNLIQIGHNVRIGRGTVIAAQTGVSGSVRIGAGVLMGGQVGMAEHLTIGDGAQLAAQSGLMRDVPAGERWAGAPAKPAKKWFREITLLANLAAKNKAGGDAQD